MRASTVCRRWAIVPLAVAGVLAGCVDQGRLDTNVPESIDEACASLPSLPQPPTTKDEAEAVRDAAVDRMSVKYSVNQSGISRCGDDFVVTIGLQRGDVSATDKAFVLDGVGVIVIARPDIYQPF